MQENIFKLLPFVIIFFIFKWIIGLVIGFGNKLQEELEEIGLSKSFYVVFVIIALIIIICL